MSRAFFESRENQDLLRRCQRSLDFIPIVMNGVLHPIREKSVGLYPVSPNLSAEDFALGLEVLGCELARNGTGDVVVREPQAFKNDVWRARAQHIQAVMSDHWEGRATELSDFVHERSVRDI